MSTNALRAAITGDKPEDRKTIRHYLTDPRVQKGLGAVAGKYLAPDRMLKLVTNAIDRNPRLADCEPRSVLGAVMMSMALGLEPNTPQQHAFLIPYKRRALVGGKWVDVYDCQFQIGARGFLILADRTDKFMRIIARAVRQGDLFEHEEGSKTFLRYVRAMRDRGELIGAFSHAIYKNGAESALVLPLDEIEKIRAKSETYRALTRAVALAENEKERAKAEAALAETPWVMWIDDMAAKSATKKHAKEWPIGGADPVSIAASVDDAAERGTIDLASLAEPALARAVAEGETEPPQLENAPSPTIEQAAIQAAAAAAEAQPAQAQESKPETEKPRVQEQPPQTQPETRQSQAPKSK